MEKQILLPITVQRELRETFRVSRGDLYRALNYRRNSPRAQMLRTAALQRGGLVYMNYYAPTGYCPTVETTNDNELLRQRFADGRIELAINKSTSKARILIDGNEVACFENMTTSAWGDILYSLQQVYNQLNS